MEPLPEELWPTPSSGVVLVPTRGLGLYAEGLCDGQWATVEVVAVTLVAVMGDTTLLLDECLVDVAGETVEVGQLMEEGRWQGLRYVTPERRG